MCGSADAAAIKWTHATEESVCGRGFALLGSAETQANHGLLGARRTLSLLGGDSCISSCVVMSSR
jgi:hypothetical protein